MSTLHRPFPLSFPPSTVLIAGLLGGCATTPASESGSGAAVTWYRDVRPVFDTNCARCHSDAGIALSFDDPAVAQAYASAMKDKVEAGEMPPPAPDPNCRDYTDSTTFFLTAEDRAVFTAWVEAGATLGDPADAPGARVAPTLAPFDLELHGSAPYAPQFVDDVNDYRCFRLDLNNTSAVYITGLEPLIDNPRIVHHVVLFDAPANAGSDEVEDPTAGFACGGFGEQGWDFVAGWAPGGGPIALPEGMGIKMGRDAHLVLQMHYYASGPDAYGATDQSGYGLKLADDVDEQVYVYPIGTYDFTIPAGDATAHSDLIFPWAADYPAVDILGVFPHMHQLGSGFDMTIAHADATQDCLVHMDDWNFHNQITALYTETAPLRAGDVVSMQCRWDNSAANPAQTSDPPIDVSFGEGSNDEMCFGFTYAVMAD